MKYKLISEDMILLQGVSKDTVKLFCAVRRLLDEDTYKKFVDSSRVELTLEDSTESTAIPVIGLQSFLLSD